MSIMVFASYASEDERLWKKLEVNLAPRPDGPTSKIQLWNPHKNIIGGTNRKQEINNHLQQAQIFLLLVSSDYLFDAECREQTNRALARMKQEPGQVYVIPILLRPSLLQGSSLEELEIYPRNRVAISRWPDPDDAIIEVTKEIYDIIEHIGKNAPNGSGTPDTSNPAPHQNQYNLSARTITTDIMGNNYGTITNNNGSGSNGSSDSDTTNKRRTSQTRSAARQSKVTDVGILIALKSEFNVLFADIQKNHTQVYDSEIDEYYYTFEHNSTAKGRPYRCVVTLIGEGQDNATLQTQKMITRWNPATLVLPGIAGSLSDRVRLGDVVIASQVDGYLVNAMANPIAGQAGYALAPSSEVYRASPVLLNAVRHFEFTSPELFQAWEADCQKALQQLVLRPEDRATFQEKRWLREQTEIIEGHIASGSVVSAAPAFTEWLKTQDRKFMAVEMEAVGMMSAVYRQAAARETLILRGISDLADANKAEFDKMGGGLFRKYAMRNAVQLLWSFLDAGLLQQKA